MKAVTVTSSPEGFRWLTDRDPGWRRAWAVLHSRAGRTNCMNCDWQYMGTEGPEGDEPAQHVFRSRSEVDGLGRYQRINVEADDFSSPTKGASK